MTESTTMRLLITGADGFLGHNLVSLLAKPGRKIMPLIHKASPQKPLLSPLPMECEGKDAAFMKEALTAAQPDVILHLAGRTPKAGGPPPIPGKASAFVADNSQTANAIVQAAQTLSPPPRLIFASSAAVYMSGGLRKQYKRTARDIIWAREKDAQMLHDNASTYAIAKFLAERSIMDYKGPWTLLRLPTVIGPHDTRGTFLHLLALHIMVQKLPAAPMLQRCADYLHIEDLAQGIEACMNAPKAAKKIINLGSGRATTGFQALQTMLDERHAFDIRFVPPGSLWPLEQRKEPYPGTVLSLTRARRLLGFAPRQSLAHCAQTIWRDVVERGPAPYAAMFPNFTPL